MGELGFLTEVTETRGDAACSRASSPARYEIERRMTLAATLERRGPRGAPRFRALNDVVITNGALARIVELRRSRSTACRSRPTAPTA